MIKVLLGAQQELIRMGLTICLNAHNEIELVGHVENHNSTLTVAKKTQPRVILLDADLPDRYSLALSRKIREYIPSTNIFFLSNSLRPEVVRQAIALEICGYAMKSISSRELINAITSISADEKYYSSEVVEYLVNYEQRIQSPSLTSRESCILRHVASGLNNKQMARELNISVRTVECHKRNIMKKLNISCTPELIRYALLLDMGR